MEEITGITAIYHGQSLTINDLPKYTDINVYTIHQINNEQILVQELAWVYERIIIKDNSFVFTIKHNSFYYDLTVPITGDQPSGLHAFYLGPPVLIGRKYDTGKLYVDLLLKDGTIKVLRPEECIISDTIVNYEKNNIYDIEYQGLKDKFFVYGYQLKNTKDIDFKIFLIHDNGYEEDLTDMFYDSLFDTILNKVYVNINKLNNTLFTATYRLFLPKNTGMYQKYATEWTVYKDTYNIQVTLNKIFT